jgi:YD repeat-containing protein
MSKIVSVILFSLLSTALFAGVNIKNGNFYISYTDHDFSGKKGVDITRTYNSKSSGAGLFGNGWGCDYETFIIIMGDGSLVVAEHGAGAKTFFETGTIDEDLLANCINQISSAAIKNKDINNNPSAIAAYKEKLRNSQEQRAIAWLKYLKLNLVQHFNNAVNSVWQSADRGFQTITKLDATTYKRVSNDGYELFNNNGQLLGEYDKYGKLKFTIDYNKNGKMQTLTDAVGNVLTFTFNADDLITSITSSKGKSTYKYNGKDLVESIDVNDNWYKYGYDINYNMTSITYSDSTTMLMEYYPTNQFVKKITDRNNVATEYVYVQFFDDNGAVNDDHYATYVIKQNAFDQLDSNYYEYEIKTKATGARYTYKIVTIINKIKTETIYDENSLPLSIVRGKSKTTFKYNSKGGLVFKETSTEIIRSTYNETETKIIRYEILNKYYQDTTIYTYTYNEKEDLVYATKDTTWVRLSYNADHRISKMEYNDGTITFEYNTIGKPSVMTLAGITNGMITVDYDDNGEIKKVNSPDGSNMSLKITSAFQQLMNITKPAGVNLGL